MYLFTPSSAIYKIGSTDFLVRTNFIRITKLRFVVTISHCFFKKTDIPSTYFLVPGEMPLFQYFYDKIHVFCIRNLFIRNVALELLKNQKIRN